MHFPTNSLYGLGPRLPRTFWQSVAFSSSRMTSLMMALSSGADAATRSPSTSRISSLAASGRQNLGAAMATYARRHGTLKVGAPLQKGFRPAASSLMMDCVCISKCRAFEAISSRSSELKPLVFLDCAVLMQV